MEQLMESPLLLAGAAVAVVLGGMAAVVVYFLYFSPPPSAEGATSAITLKLRSRRARGRPPRAANVLAPAAATAAGCPVRPATLRALRPPWAGPRSGRKRR